MNSLLMRTLRDAMGMCLSLALMAGPAMAASDFSYLPDPTKPPEGFGPAAQLSQTADQLAGKDDAATGAASGSSHALDKASTPQALTLIRIDARTGQGMAVLDGRMVRVGDRIGDARVASINATGVELETPKGRKKYSLWERTSITDLMKDAASKDGGKDKP